MTTKTAILQSIRHKCLDCCCQQPAEVRECRVTRCALWPFRFGTDPDPSQSRGFAKPSVYTASSEPGSPAGTSQPDKAARSEIPRVHVGSRASRPVRSKVEPA
jgi:hypothetical protein